MSADPCHRCRGRAVYHDAPCAPCRGTGREHHQLHLVLRSAVRDSERVRVVKFPVPLWHPIAERDLGQARLAELALVVGDALRDGADVRGRMLAERALGLRLGGAFYDLVREAVAIDDYVTN